MLLRFCSASVTAIDRSAEAIRLTKENALFHAVAHRLSLHHATLTEDGLLPNSNGNGTNVLGDGRFDIVVSNPPYVPTKEIENLEAGILNFEDLNALDGGTDGLDVVRETHGLSSAQSWTFTLVYSTGT